MRRPVARSGRGGGGAGVGESALFGGTPRRTQYGTRRRGPMSSTSRSKFALLLSMKPTARPARSAGSGGAAVLARFAVPTGLSTLMRVIASPPAAGFFHNGPPPPAAGAWPPPPAPRHLDPTPPAR